MLNGTRIRIFMTHYFHKIFCGIKGSEKDRFYSFLVVRGGKLSAN